MTETTVKNSIAMKFPHLSMTDVDEIYEMALNDYLRIVYPFDKSIVAIPVGHERDYSWVKARMIDIVERSGCSSAKAYSENGLSISFSSAYITDELRRQLVGRVGVPK